MNNTKPITIGILAGMGPKSTSPFLDCVIEECRRQYGAKDDIDFPHILIYSLPTPFYINQRIDDEAMVAAICGGLQRLESVSVNFIAMPCNTAHKYFTQLKQCIDIPLLHIVEATIEHLDKDTKKAALFATRTTIESAIYRDAFDHAQIELILKEEWQQSVDELIQSVKSGASYERISAITKQLSKSLAGKEIDTVILACTDLAAVQNMFSGFNVIDSSRALAVETVRMYLKHRS